MKIGFFITARLKSTRLKRKILLDLNGKKVIDRIIERAKKVKGIDNVVLCTSINQEDSELIDYANKNNIDFFAGSEDDVLHRLMSAAIHYRCDAFVNITADNPLFSIYTSNILVDIFKKNNYDFINTKGLPIGMNTYLFNLRVLRFIVKFKDEVDTEIWGPFINQPNFFNIHELIIKSKLNESKRITIDYLEDYYLVKEIYKNFDPMYIPNVFDIIKLFSENPNLYNINFMRKQKYLSKKEIVKIKNLYNSKKDFFMEYFKENNLKYYPNYSFTKIEL